MIHKGVVAAIAAVLTTGGAYAQSSDPAHLSLVAGYKAAFICSGTFNAGRSLSEIEGDELNRFYPAYREAMATLPPAKIDKKAKTVSVAYAEGFPPRISAWRPFLGCGQLPTGADQSFVARLPRVDVSRLEAERATYSINDLGSTKNNPANPALDTAVAAAFDRATYGEGTETTAVVVVRDGKIIAEKYRKGFDAKTPQRTWSVAKSIAATIIGAAVEEGLINADDPAGLAQWSAPGDPRGAITIKNLMQMASGLDATPAGNRTDDVYFGGGRVIDHATTRRIIAVPGSRWYYANNDTMLLARALRERMKDDAAFLRFPFEKVLSPLRMDHTFLETDWNGDFVLSSQVWTTARDLAQLGLLYLNDGVWAGKRILPQGWAAFVATPAPAQPPLAGEDGSPRPGYGAQFWLFDARFGLPDGSYAALGNRGQYVMIIPERNVVIVRRGFDDGGGFDIAHFSKDVLAATE